MQLAGTGDLVQVVTSGTGTIHCYASWVDNANGTVTPGRTNTPVISSAGTTTIVGSPAASTQRRVKMLSVNNSDAAGTNTTTVRLTDGTTAENLYKATLIPSEAVSFTDDGGWQYFDSTGIPKQSMITGTNLTNASTTDQIGTAADRYLVGSDLTIGNRMKAGSVIRHNVVFTKTAAGTGAPVTIIRYGTGATTSDAGVGTITWQIQTAASDTGWLNIETVVRTVGANSTLQVNAELKHRLAATGIGTTFVQIAQFTGTGVDLTLPTGKIGISQSPANGTWTFQTVTAEAFNII